MTRMPRPFAVLALAVVGGLTVLAGCSGENPYQASRSANNGTVATSSTPPDSTVFENDFLPEENISSCVGLVERPNCGSESKGEWRMYVTFAVLMSGMGFIGWRITRSVRARDALMRQVAESTPEPVGGSARD